MIDLNFVCEKFTDDRMAIRDMLETVFYIPDPRTREERELDEWARWMETPYQTRAYLGV